MLLVKEPNHGSASNFQDGIDVSAARARSAPARRASHAANRSRLRKDRGAREDGDVPTTMNRNCDAQETRVTTLVRSQRSGPHESASSWPHLLQIARLPGGEGAWIPLR